MKANDDKCHLIVPNHKNASVTLCKENIEAEDSVTLIGISIDKELNFFRSCSKLNQKRKPKTTWVSQNLEIRQ